MMCVLHCFPINILKNLYVNFVSNKFSRQVAGRRLEILAKSYTTFGRPLVSRTPGTRKMMCKVNGDEGRWHKKLGVWELEWVETYMIFLLFFF